MLQVPYGVVLCNLVALGRLGSFKLPNKVNSSSSPLPNCISSIQRSYEASCALGVGLGSFRCVPLSWSSVSTDLKAWQSAVSQQSLLD